MPFLPLRFLPCWRACSDFMLFIRSSLNFILTFRTVHNPIPHHLSAAAVKSLQLCLTLCDPIDGFPVPGILQARTLEWVAISFSNAWKWKVKVKSPSRVRLLATPWTAAHQAPPSMGFSRQECWSGLPLPSPSPLWSLLFIKDGNYTLRPI